MVSGNQGVEKWRFWGVFWAFFQKTQVGFLKVINRFFEKNYDFFW